MPEYLSVCLSIFVLMAGISLIWLCFWSSMYIANQLNRKD